MTYPSLSTVYSKEYSSFDSVVISVVDVVLEVSVWLVVVSAVVVVLVVASGSVVEEVVVSSPKSLSIILCFLVVVSDDASIRETFELNKEVYMKKIDNIPCFSVVVSVTSITSKTCSPFWSVTFSPFSSVTGANVVSGFSLLGPPSRVNLIAKRQEENNITTDKTIAIIPINFLRGITAIVFFFLSLTLTTGNDCLSFNTDEQLRQYIDSSGILAPQNGHTFKTSTPICQQTIYI